MVLVSEPHKELHWKVRAGEMPAHGPQDFPFQTAMWPSASKAPFETSTSPASATQPTVHRILMSDLTETPSACS